MFLPAFRLVRQAEANNARTFTSTSIVWVCHKLVLCKFKLVR